jgi:hypothetical protein
MKHIVGLFDANKEFKIQELENDHRLCFDTYDDRINAYFSLISPVFERYALQQAGIGINSINVFFLLRETDYSYVLTELGVLKFKFKKYPKSWNEYIGSKKIGKEPEIAVSPLVFRNRILKIISSLESIILLAKRTQKNIVYGNGVCYRPLSGQKTIPGVFTYS